MWIVLAWVLHQRCWTFPAGTDKMPTRWSSRHGGLYTDPPLWAMLTSSITERIIEGTFQQLDSELLGLIQYMWTYMLNSCPAHFSPVWFLEIILVALGLGCMQAFSSCGEPGLLSSFSAWASQCGGFSCCRGQALGAWAAAAEALRLSCLEACGIFWEQGLNLCPLNRQADT